MFMMYIIMSETFIKIEFSWNFKTNLPYEQAKNLRYNIHCFDLMLIFPNFFPPYIPPWLVHFNVQIVNVLRSKYE